MARDAHQRVKDTLAGICARALPTTAEEAASHAADPAMMKTTLSRYLQLSMGRCPGRCYAVAHDVYGRLRLHIWHWGMTLSCLLLNICWQIPEYKILSVSMTSSLLVCLGRSG